MSHPPARAARSGSPSQVRFAARCADQCALLLPAIVELELPPFMEFVLSLAPMPPMLLDPAIEVASVVPDDVPEASLAGGLDPPHAKQMSVAMTATVATVIGFIFIASFEAARSAAAGRIAVAVPPMG